MKKKTYFEEIDQQSEQEIITQKSNAKNRFLKKLGRVMFVFTMLAPLPPLTACINKTPDDPIQQQQPNENNQEFEIKKEEAKEFFADFVSKIRTGPVTLVSLNRFTWQISDKIASYEDSKLGRKRIFSLEDDALYVYANEPGEHAGMWSRQKFDRNKPDSITSWNSDYLYPFYNEFVWYFNTDSYWRNFQYSEEEKNTIISRKYIYEFTSENSFHAYSATNPEVNILVTLKCDEITLPTKDQIYEETIWSPPVLQTKAPAIDIPVQALSYMPSSQHSKSESDNSKEFEL